MTSILRPWVTQLPLRLQGTLMAAMRGCDDEPKQWTSRGVAYSPGRRLTAFIRWCFMVPADAREVDREFMMSLPPNPFKPSEFGHLPQHWYSHAMHALQVIGYEHPDPSIRDRAHELYLAMVENMHLRPESHASMWRRLTEDRINRGPSSARDAPCKDQ